MHLRMNLACIFVSSALIAAPVLLTAQTPATAPNPATRAAIQGIVTKDPGTEPVKKALIELIAENQSEGGDYAAITGPDGVFRIEGILPGRYRLFAERTGLLEINKHHARSEGRVLTLGLGEELKDLRIRLQAAAVVRGRVTDEDGDPLPNAQVAVERQTFGSGHSRWEQAGSERTNDLGEYRVANLPGGNYYVSVTPPPDFKSLFETAGQAATPETPATNPMQSLAYRTTYYPGTTDRAQAVSIQLRAGDELPLDFSLIPSPSLTIRGSVVNLPACCSAAIMLRSHDFSLSLNDTEMRPDGSFLIRDVAPGAYTIVATVENSPVPLMARQFLQVANNVEGLRLSPQPGARVHGRVRFEGGTSAESNAQKILLLLRAADGDDDLFSAFSLGEGFSNAARVGSDGAFEWKNVPPGTYYVQLASESGGDANWYLKSALTGNRDVEDTGVVVAGAAIQLDVAASPHGGIVDGAVAGPKGEPVANAVVVAVPDGARRSRPDSFRKTFSDQSGRFAIHGLRPGDYTFFAWEAVEGDAYYDPAFLQAYDGKGIALGVREAEHNSIELPLIPEAEDSAY
jgi:Carboxypeptidase regulatory-like domain